VGYPLFLAYIRHPFKKKVAHSGCSGQSDAQKKKYVRRLAAIALNVTTLKSRLAVELETDKIRDHGKYCC
jgi:hypothetical protein